MVSRVAIGIGVSALLAGSAASAATDYSVLIHGGTIYDGSGGAPYDGDVAINGDRIA